MKASSYETKNKDLSFNDDMSFSEWLVKANLIFDEIISLAKPKVEEKPLDHHTTFAEWMRAVNRQLIIFIGQTTDDLPDQLYRDWYDDGLDPKSAAEDASLNAGYNPYADLGENVEAVIEAVFDHVLDDRCPACINIGCDCTCQDEIPF